MSEAKPAAKRPWCVSRSRDAGDPLEQQPLPPDRATRAMRPVTVTTTFGRVRLDGVAARRGGGSCPARGFRGSATRAAAVDGRGRPRARQRVADLRNYGQNESQDGVEHGRQDRASTINPTATTPQTADVTQTVANANQP